MVSLSIDPPPSSLGDRPPQRGPLRLLAFLAGLVLAFVAGVFVGRASQPRPATVAPIAPPTATQTAAPAATATATATPTVTPVPVPVPGPAAITSTAAVAAPPAAPTPPGARRLAVTISGPLEEAIAAALPKDAGTRAEELTAVVNRLLVWDLRVSRDARKGDRLEVVFQPGTAGVPEPVVLAIRYTSSKLGATLAAYRFQPRGARWPRYYRADGREVELRLADPPLADYEQITSLLRDGRRHKGVDFKAPVGSPVAAPFAGVVERRNWNFSGNGNCLDLRDPASGRHAIFLHLDAIPREMAVGRAVKKGEVIARSGNSGHSFAPHLHYQLEDASGRVLDPFDVLETERRGVPAGDRDAFEAERARLDAAIAG